jgi:hypothetical protein
MVSKSRFRQNSPRAASKWVADWQSEITAKEGLANFEYANRHPLSH